MFVTKGDIMRDYGLQMYGLRDITPTDMRLALKTAADIGYKQIEFAGFFDNSPEEIRAWLDEYGLTAISTHTGLDLLRLENIAETVATHRALGLRSLACPGFKMNTREELDYAMDIIAAAEPILRAEGLTLSVHNHAREFMTTPYGALAHKEFEEKTNVQFQLDTYWIFVAGKDPVEQMNYYHSLGRLSSIHIRDGMKNTDGRPLGEGEAPVEAVLTRALELDVPIIVENDRLEPSGKAQCTRCFEFLRKYHESH